MCLCHVCCKHWYSLALHQVEMINSADYNIICFVIECRINFFFIVLPGVIINCVLFVLFG